MKVSFGDYSKKLDASVLVAMAVFKVLQEKYPSKRISEIAETTSGGTPLRNKPEFYNGNIAWLKSGELNDGIISKSEETITELGLKNSSAKLLPKGTLLIAMYGATTGKVGILDIEATTNQAVCAIFPDVEVDRDFLFWFLRQHRYEYIRISKGGAQPNISQTLINQTEVPLPNLGEQKKIAQLLFEIESERKVNENLIDKEFLKEVRKFLHLKENSDQIAIELSHQLELVRQLHQALLREAIQGKLVEQDYTDEPAEILLNRIKAEKEKFVAEKKIKKEKFLPEIKAEEIPFEIPSNWTWCRLGEIISTIFDGPFGSHLKTADYTDLGVQVIRLENIGFMKFNIEKETFISEEKYKTISQHTVYENDVLVSSFIADGVKTTLIPNLKYTAIAKADCFTLRTFDNWAVKKFIVYALSSQPIFDELLQFSHGMTRLRINTSQLKKLMFPLPPLAEQKRIVEKLEKLMAFCGELEANIRESKTQSEILLQVALKEALEPR
jgi:type I restriction enzyme S subunit